MFGKYNQSQTLTTNISTNAFSYTDREQRLWILPSITITPWKLGSRDDVVLGDHIVIEEIDHHGALQSRTGLEHNIYIDGDVPVAIMDNHNHALPLWRRYRKQQPIIVHIDAHADLEPVQAPIPDDVDEHGIRDYTHTETHIGSFILPALDSGLIADCVQVRSSYALENLYKTLPLSFSTWSDISTKDPRICEDDTVSYILDIDLDFWALEKDIPPSHLSVIKEIIDRKPLLVTIATSPYFLDQDRALHFLEQLRPVLQFKP